MLSAYLLQKSPLPVEIILCASSQDGISKAIAFIISAIAQSLLAKGQSWYWLLPVGKLNSTFQSLLRIFFNHKLVSEVDAA
ncbi:hypothetical protein [Nostoc sp.]|uniref:hypothetical protein n=1 Tax=Nostoc sp. TaxID=1180 RepID=UPI002FF748A4